MYSNILENYVDNIGDDDYIISHKDNIPMNVKKFNRELNEVANILTNMKLNVGDITGLYEHIKKIYII